MSGSKICFAMIVWWLCYNKMRGEKIIVIFLLLALAHTQWIVEQQPEIIPIPGSMDKYIETQQSDYPVHERFSIVEVYPQILPEEKQQQEKAAEVKAEEKVLIAFPEAVNPFQKSVRFPNDQIEKHGHPKGHEGRHGSNKHKGQMKKQHLKQAGTQSQNQGIQGEAYYAQESEEDDSNGIIFLVVIGVFCLILVKTCMRAKKCGMKTARMISAFPQQINTHTPIVISGQTQAIDEAIRFHEAQIARLRNSAYSMPATYHVYQ